MAQYDDDGRIVANQEALPAARALEVLKDLFADPEGRELYTTSGDRQQVFDDWKQRLDEPALRNAEYGDIPDDSRAALEEASAEQLEFLARLDETFVRDGLFVEVPSPGFLMFH
jgi:hypothetical protein